jgi:hypothetical protein
MRRASAGFAFVLFVFPVALYAHSLTFLGGLDNFMYDPNDTGAQNRFRLPTPALLVNAAIEGEFSSFSSYHIGFENDTVLHYAASANSTFNLWTFRLGIGAFMLLFNEGNEAYVPGVSGSLGLEIPGLVLASVEYGQNIFIDMSKSGNINANYGKLEAAIWFPFVLFRFSMERRSFTSTPTDTYAIRNALLRYQASLDFFSKLSAIQLTLGGGLKTVEKAVEPVLPAGSSMLPAKNDATVQFAFVHLAYTLSPGFELLLNIEAPISSTSNGLFLNALAGFRLTLFD